MAASQRDVSELMTCAWSRAVLAEAIMQQLLEGLQEDLDVSVASASVGPAPQGDTPTPAFRWTWQQSCASVYAVYQHDYMGRVIHMSLKSAEVSFLSA